MITNLKKKSIIREIWLRILPLWCVCILFHAHGQIVVSNPYTTFYHIEDHWTNELQWSKVYQANAINGLINMATSEVDSLQMQITLDSISRMGGGILYFPGGTYFLNFDLRMAEGVVIRGADPLIVTSAKVEGYSPPTKFVFPKYEPVFSGKGTPNSTAFKKIYADTKGIKNFGLVNIDINRGRIEFHGELAPDEAEQVRINENLLPKYYHKNILIFGIRQNNVAAPDPLIPTKFMIDEGRGWQRWPRLDAGNIDILISKNCVIANCRLNDQITDNFEQPKYLLHSGREIEGKFAKFKYDFHTAIWVNVRAYDLSSFEGIEISDNYIRTSSYWDKVVVRGKNPVIKNNIDNGADFVNDLEIENDGQWEIDLQWKKIAENKSLFTNQIYSSNETSDTIPYRFLAPKSKAGKKYPLVLFLHGIGEHGNDNTLQLKHLVYYFGTEKIRNEFPAFVAAPQIPPDKQWFKIDKNGKVLSFIPGLIETLANEYPIDKKRIYLVGISSGGNAALKLISLYPKKFASVVVVSALHRFTQEEMKNFKKTSICFYYGMNDVNTPSAYFSLLGSQLEKEGVKVKIVGFKDAAHAIWTKIGEDIEFYEWLFSQHM